MGWVGCVRACMRTCVRVCVRMRGLRYVRVRVRVRVRVHGLGWVSVEGLAFFSGGPPLLGWVRCGCVRARVRACVPARACAYACAGCVGCVRACVCACMYMGWVGSLFKV